jgi:hypothetical protein
MCVPLLLLLLLSLGAVDAAGPVSDFEFAGVVHQVPQEWSMQERQAANFVKFDMYPMALQAYQRMCSDDHRASLPPVVSAAARLQLGRMQFKIGHFEGAALSFTGAAERLEKSLQSGDGGGSGGGGDGVHVAAARSALVRDSSRSCLAQLREALGLARMFQVRVQQTPVARSCAH